MDKMKVKPVPTDDREEMDLAENELQKNHREFSSYAMNKTIAQGLLDFALLATNVNQLKYILHVGNRHPHYMFLICVISASFCFQVLVGILLLLVGNRSAPKMRASLLNQMITIIIFIITVLNVVIAGFNMEVTGPSIEACKKFFREVQLLNINLNGTDSM